MISTATVLPTWRWRESASNSETETIVCETGLFLSIWAGPRGLRKRHLKFSMDSDLMARGIWSPGRRCASVSLTTGDFVETNCATLRSVRRAGRQ